MPEENTKNSMGRTESPIKKLLLSGIDCIIAEIKQRRWRWLEHVMRMDDNSNPKIVLTWTPQGKSTQSGPRSTWRRTIYLWGETGSQVVLV